MWIPCAVPGEHLPYHTIPYPTLPLHGTALYLADVLCRRRLLVDGIGAVARLAGQVVRWLALVDDADDVVVRIVRPALAEEEFACGDRGVTGSAQAT